MKAALNTVVAMHYTLTDDSGEVLDSSAGRDPLAYLHGHSNIIPGLEQALEGKEAGHKSKVTVAPAEGYGEKNPEAVFEALKIEGSKCRAYAKQYSWEACSKQFADNLYKNHRRPKEVSLLAQTEKTRC